MANADKRAAQMMSGGEAVVDALVDHGVDTVFGIPGIQLDPLYDGFYNRSNQIRVVHTRHEQGSAFMAMGYAQSSERTGVFAVVPGPGLLNGMAAVSTAVAANTPVLGITGQIPSYQIGLNYGIAHELRDQLSVSDGVVYWNRRAEHPTEVPALLQDGFKFMHSGRKQPAIFEMAPDLFAARAPVDPLPPLTPVAGAEPDEDKVRRAAARLSKAKCPAIFVGGGAYGAETEVRALAERLNAPVIESVNGRGVIPSDHPLFYNILAGQAIWDEADVVVVIGSRFIATALAWGRESEVDLIRIDVDPTQIGKPREAWVALLTSAKQGVGALLDELGAGPAPKREVFLSQCHQAGEDIRLAMEALGNLPELSDALRRAMPTDAYLFADVTQLGYYTRHAWPVYEPKTILGPSYQATLGYAYPAALGAKLAHPDKKVVALAGDGGFMFTMQELATAAQHGIAVVVIALDNKSYGNVKTIQDERFGGRNIAVELHNPDFVAMARSFGMAAEEARTGAELESVLTRFLAAEEPALISIPMGEVPSIWSLVKRPPSQGKTED